MLGTYEALKRSQKPATCPDPVRDYTAVCKLQLCTDTAGVMGSTVLSVTMGSTVLSVTMGSTVLSVTMGSTVLSVCHSDLQHGLFKTVQTVPIVEDKFVSRSITDNCFACSVQCTDYTARK